MKTNRFAPKTNNNELFYLIVYVGLSFFKKYPSIISERVTMSKFLQLILILLFTNLYSQSQWTWRNPLPQGNAINSIASNGTEYLAVGNAGTLLRSTNGINWQYDRFKDKYSFQSILWDGQKYVLIGNSYSAISENGKEFNVSIDTLIHSPINMAFNGNTYVAACRGKLIYSKDGLHWKPVDFTTNRVIGQVIWSGDQFVVIGPILKSPVLDMDSLFVSTSKDGIEWSKKFVNLIYYSHPVDQISFNGENYTIAGYDGYVMNSTDLSYWTVDTIDEYDPISSIVWTGKNYLILTSEKSKIYSSLKGTNWECIDSVGGRQKTMCWVNNHAFIFQYGIDQSANGKNWTHCLGDGISIGYVYCFNWCHDRFIALCSERKIVFSKDGITWSCSDFNFTNETPYNIFTGVNYFNNRFTAYTNLGHLYTSQDGNTWLADTSARIRNWNQFVNADTILMANSPYGILGLSKNGIDFKEFYFKELTSSLIYANNTILAYSDSAICYSSKDMGITWEKDTLNEKISFKKIVWTGNSFGAIGKNEYYFYYSIDGFNWSKMNLKSLTRTYDLKDLIWCGNKFISVTDNGNIYSSPNGLVWKEENTYAQAQLLYLANNNQRIVTIGYGNPILSSEIDQITSAKHMTGKWPLNRSFLLSHKNNQFTVKLSSGFFNQSMIKITNLKGQVLLNQRLIFNNGIGYFSKVIPKGLYLFTITNGTNSIYKKYIYN